MKRPSAVFTDDVAGHQKTGAGDGAVYAQLHPGSIQKTRFPEEPEPIPGGDPVRAEILGIAVTGQGRVISGTESGVHFFHKVRVYIIIGVKYKVSVIGIFSFFRKAFEQIIQGIAFADLLPVIAVIDESARTRPSAPSDPYSCLRLHKCPEVPGDSSGLSGWQSASR